METELQRLVVRLIGDSSSYQKMLEQAASDLQRFSQETQHRLGRVDDIISSYARMRQAEGLVADAERAKSVAMQHGSEIMAQLAQASAEYGQKIQYYTALLQVGAISQDAFNAKFREEYDLLLRTDPIFRAHIDLQRQATQALGPLATSMDLYIQKLQQLKSLFEGKAINSEQFQRLVNHAVIDLSTRLGQEVEKQRVIKEAEQAVWNDKIRRMSEQIDKQRAIHQLEASEASDRTRRMAEEISKQRAIHEQEAAEYASRQSRMAAAISRSREISLMEQAEATNRTQRMAEEISKQRAIHEQEAAEMASRQSRMAAAVARQREINAVEQAEQAAYVSRMAAAIQRHQEITAAENAEAQNRIAGRQRMLQDAIALSQRIAAAEAAEAARREAQRNEELMREQQWQEKMHAQRQANAQRYATPQERFDAGRADVYEQFGRGVMTIQQLNAAMKELTETRNRDMGVTAAWAKLQSEVDAIKKAAIPVAVMEAQNIARLQALYSAGLITMQEYMHATLQIALAQQARNRAADAPREAAWNKLQQEGASVTNSVRTAVETYAATQARLNSLLASGIITQETYNRAMQRAAATRDAPAIAERNKLLQEGKQIAQSVETATERYRREMANLNKLYQSGYIDITTYNRAVAKITADRDKDAAGMRRNNRLMQEGQNVTRSVETSTERYAREVANLNKLWAAGAISGETYNRALAQMSVQTEQTNDNARQLVESMVNALKIMGKSAVTAFSDFNQEMTKATSIMEGVDAGSDVFMKLQKTALDLSTKGPQAPKELAEAYYFLASAGVSADASLRALPKIQQFATAGAFDLGMATEYSTGVLAAMGLASENAEIRLNNLSRVINTVTHASMLSQGSTRQFAQALTRDAAASAKIMGIELEEVTAVLAAYGKQNIYGSLAGHTFGRMIRLITQAANKAEPVFEKLGIDVFDKTTQGFRKVADIVEDFEKVLLNVPAKMRTQVLSSMGLEVLSQKALLPLIGMSGEIRKFEKNLKKGGDYVSNVANKQLQSFANQIAMVKNSITVAAIEIGEVLAPALLFVSNLIRDAVKVWQGFSESVRRNIIWTAVISAGMLAIVPAALAVQFAISGMMGMFSAFGALFAGPGLVAAAVGLFAGILKIVTTLINPLTMALMLVRAMGGSILFYFGPTMTVVKWLVSFGAALLVLIKRAGGLEQTWRKVTAAFEEFWQFIEPIRTALTDLFQVVGKGLINGFYKLGDAMITWSQMIFDKFMKFMLDDLSIDWDRTVDNIAAGIKFVTMLFYNFGSIAAGAWDLIRDGVMGTVQWVQELGISAKDMFVNWFDANSKFIYGIGLSALAVISLIGTVKALIAIMTLLKVKVILSMTAQVAAFLAVKAAALAYGVFLGILALKTILLKVHTILCAVAFLFLKGVLWLTSLGFNVLAASVVGVVVGFQAVALAISGVTALFSIFTSLIFGVIGAVASAVRGVTEFFGMLSQSGKLAGPITYITGLLSQWKDILWDVFSLLKSGDTDNAWKLFAAGGKLAIAQIQALWAPLWGQISTGFLILWEYIFEVFYQKWRLARARMMKEFKESVAPPKGAPLAEAAAAETQNIFDEIEKSVNSSIAQAQHKMSVQIEGFRPPKPKNVIDAGLWEVDIDEVLKNINKSQKKVKKAVADVPPPEMSFAEKLIGFFGNKLPIPGDIFSSYEEIVEKANKDAKKVQDIKDGIKDDAPIQWPDRPPGFENILPKWENPNTDAIKNAEDNLKKVYDDMEMDKFMKPIRDAMDAEWAKLPWLGSAEQSMTNQLNSMVEEAKKKGEQLGIGFTKGAGKEMRKFEGVLWNSSEAIKVWYEYQDRLANTADYAKSSKSKLTINGAGMGGMGPKERNFEGIPKNTPKAEAEQVKQNDKQIVLLENIRDIQKALLEKKDIRLDDAGFA